MKKDEALTKIGKLEQRIKDLEALDADVREELSKAMGSPVEGEYSYNRKRVVYSWLEIFKELGKLLERKKQTDLEQSVHNAWENLRMLEDEVRRLSEPKPPCHP